MPDERSFRIRVLREECVTEALEFHKQHLTKHLWPRTLEEFKDLVASESLHEVRETTGGSERLVGICYVASGTWPETGEARFEFGGIFVTDDRRGRGVASALGKAALSSHFYWNSKPVSLIAHVHEFNEKPRGVLQNHLGFVHIGEEIPPADVVPEGLEKNDKGDVVGHLFEFQRKQLVKFADWLAGFSGSIEGKDGKSLLKIDLAIARDPYKTEVPDALRQIAVS
jgi:GNAT superfamily N-acetyltransferase